MSDEFVENLKQPSAWLRILFMAGFVIALYVAGVVLMVLMLAQILFSLITGSDNINLRRLGAAINLYVAQILDFLTYNSELKPFPFAPFPLDEASDIAEEAAEVAAATAAARSSHEQAAETAAESAAVVQAEVAAKKAASRSSASRSATNAGAKKTGAKKTAAGKTTTSKSAAASATQPATPDAPENVATGDAAPTSVTEGQNKDV